MRFYLLDIDSDIAPFMYFGGAILGWAIFYYTIKAAVKWGTLSAMEDHQAANRPTPKTINEIPANASQIKLQERYNSGQITFEEYQSEWKRLG